MIAVWYCVFFMGVVLCTVFVYCLLYVLSVLHIWCWEKECADQWLVSPSELNLIRILIESVSSDFKLT